MKIPTDSEAKKCVVVFLPTGQRMAYNKEGNYVALPGKDYYAGENYYVFPAKLRARSAISVTIEMRKAEGVERPQDDYEIVEV